MKRIRNKQGLTLVEIIVSIAILGIVVISLLNVFSFGFNNMVFSGQKSDELLDVQTIVDDLNAQVFLTTASETAQDSIVDYLEGEGYYCVSDIGQISVQVSGEAVNFFVSEQETQAGTKGNRVTVLKFTDNGKRYAELSTFLPDRGY